jgi:hypothetical protein
MYLLCPFLSLMLMDVGSASICPKCVSKRDEVCPTVNLTVVTDDVDNAEDFISLQSRDPAEVELLAMLEDALLAILMSLFTFILMSLFTFGQRTIC